MSNIIKLVDINGSGKIDYTEFLVAASSEEKLLNAARLDDAFAFFDTVRLVIHLGPLRLNQH